MAVPICDRVVTLDPEPRLLVGGTLVASVPADTSGLSQFGRASSLQLWIWTSVVTTVWDCPKVFLISPRWCID